MGHRVVGLFPDLHGTLAGVYARSPPASAAGFLWGMRRGPQKGSGVFQPFFALAASGPLALHCPHLSCVPLPRIGSGLVFGPADRPSAHQHLMKVL